MALPPRQWRCQDGILRRVVDHLRRSAVQVGDTDSGDSRVLPQQHGAPQLEPGDADRRILVHPAGLPAEGCHVARLLGQLQSDHGDGVAWVIRQLQGGHAGQQVVGGAFLGVQVAEHREVRDGLEPHIGRDPVGECQQRGDEQHQGAQTPVRGANAVRLRSAVATQQRDHERDHGDGPREYEQGVPRQADRAGRRIGRTRHHAQQHVGREPRERDSAQHGGSGYQGREHLGRDQQHVHREDDGREVVERGQRQDRMEPHTEKQAPEAQPRHRQQCEDGGLDHHRDDGDELSDGRARYHPVETVEPDELAEQVAAAGGFRGEVGGVQLVEHREQVDHQQHETDRAARGIQPALDETVRHTRPVPDGRRPQGGGAERDGGQQAQHQVVRGRGQVQNGHRGAGRDGQGGGGHRAGKQQGGQAGQQHRHHRKRLAVGVVEDQRHREQRCEPAELLPRAGGVVRSGVAAPAH